MYAGGRGPSLARPAVEENQGGGGVTYEHGWAGPPISPRLAAAHERIRFLERESAHHENMRREAEARERMTTEARDGAAAAPMAPVFNADGETGADTAPETRNRASPNILSYLTPNQLSWAHRLIDALCQIPDMNDGWKVSSILRLQAVLDRVIAS
ncbi:unnamed protein product [Closterium sp. NIES-65]|nr:unnamed protein product [Closterium sp. NIES-65]